MEQELQLNDHNKQEFPPMHTCGFNTPLIYYIINFIFLSVLTLVPVIL